MALFSHFDSPSLNVSSLIPVAVFFFSSVFIPQLQLVFSCTMKKIRLLSFSLIGGSNTLLYGRVIPFL